jgi:hypothetical protein
VVVNSNWPKKATTFAGAKAVVFVGSDGATEGVMRSEAAALQKLADSGIGFATIHGGAINFRKDFTERPLGWYGGVQEADYTMAPVDAVGKYDGKHDHPAARGVKAFTIEDKWMNRVRFGTGMKGITPLLRVRSEQNPVKLEAGNEDIAAWAFDRPGGGRAFAFSGLHFHRSWEDENVRRLIVNGILWSAGVEVPKDGAKVEISPADLARKWQPSN